MTHEPERDIEDVVEEWFIDRYGAENVDRQVRIYLEDGEYWICDLVVDTDYATLYIEVESRTSEVRPGIGQSIGYAGDDLEKGIPVVITPRDHLSKAEADHLRMKSCVLIREFDLETQEFV